MKLADLFIKLGLKKDGFDRGIDDAKKKTNAFSSAVKKIGGIMAGAFAVERIFSFGKELLELGGIAEGVEAAFKRIGGDRYLDDLKDATRGTVSELELMKRAVMASNFQIPIENLADLFKFATKRAQETGESVDYLVNSIVLGIGRKSPLILDNLGISAVRLRQELKGAGVEMNTVQDIAAAVGRIAASELEKSGEIIETNAIKLQKLKAGWDDLKKSIATSDTVVRYFSDQLDGISIMAKVLTSDQISGWEKLRSTLFDNKEEARKLGDELEKIAKTNKQAERTAAKAKEQRKKAEIELNNLLGRSVNDLTQSEIEAAIKQSEAANEATDARIKAGKTISELKKETDALKKSLDNYGINQRAEYQNTLKQIEANEKLIQSLEKTDFEKWEEQNERIKKAIELTDSLTAANEKYMASIPSGNDFFTKGDADVSGIVGGGGVFDMLSPEKEEEIGFDTEARVAALNETEQFLNELNAIAESGIEDFIVTFAEGLGSAIATGDWENFGKAILSVVGNFLSTMGKALIAYGVAMDAFNKALTNPFAAIAAGVALIAIGGAISSLASAGPSGMSSASGYSGATSSSNSSSAAINGDVRFVLEGDKLVGAIDNSRSRRRLTS